jgi:hypothetical protein
VTVGVRHYEHNVVASRGAAFRGSQKTIRSPRSARRQSHCGTPTPLVSTMMAAPSLGPAQGM